ncbi:hypothetical protein JW968_01450 [Candidatus Woesearchaeota archaeon]|nr:hypothetical protein [Candidatus Woesearchaeota archaeon]
MIYFGYFGMAALLVSYALLNTRYNVLFVPIATIASILLTLHAILLTDIPFIVVNGFIVILLAVKWYRGDKRSHL